MLSFKSARTCALYMYERVVQYLFVNLLRFPCSKLASSVHRDIGDFNTLTKRSRSTNVRPSSISLPESCTIPSLTYMSSEEFDGSCRVAGVVIQSKSEISRCRAGLTVQGERWVNLLRLQCAWTGREEGKVPPKCDERKLHVHISCKRCSRVEEIRANGDGLRAEMM